MLVNTPPRCEIRSRMRVPTGDKNVNTGFVHPDGLPPPPPIPPACRGVGNLHQALQGMNFGDMTPLFHAIVRDIEEFLGGSRKTVVDSGKRAAESGLPGRKRKRFRGRRFRPEHRYGDFGRGSRVLG
ncbi:hypothetical protein V6N12_031219 [Hibiscus sabdariffa]|uniref:Uncharacterized protein n=1 Tax=Hibiscus sabdariffa TaxID=183260 RepID=A0ABR2EA72_9ROSI